MDLLDTKTRLLLQDLEQPELGREPSLALIHLNSIQCKCWSTPWVTKSPSLVCMWQKRSEKEGAQLCVGF